jgi:hypothetical protein
MNSYHDYYVNAYEVDSVERVLKFKLAWPKQNNEADIVQLIFSGVQGYELKNDSMVSIIFSFEELSLCNFFTKHGDNFKESSRLNGAYGSWANDLGHAIVALNKSNAKAYVLSSSIGMEGWIVADNVEEINA